MIRFENVSKVYARGARPALDGVSVDVARGEFVFLVGASGSGKSTFLRLVLREERPTRGRIYVAGRDLSRLSGWKVPSLRRGIGMVFQDFRLLPNKTVYENVAFALEVIGKPRHAIKTTVPEVLEMVGLDGKEKRRPHELSGGEQQRVAIARAFVNRPPILLADEPTGNLDPTTSLGIMRLLDRINRTGTTVIMATHDEEIVNEMRKRVVELTGGHLIRDEAAGGYGERESILPEVATTPILDVSGVAVRGGPHRVTPHAADLEADEQAEAAARRAQEPVQTPARPSRRSRVARRSPRRGQTEQVPAPAGEVEPRTPALAPVVPVVAQPIPWSSSPLVPSSSSSSSSSLSPSPSPSPSSADDGEDVTARPVDYATPSPYTTSRTTDAGMLPPSDDAGDVVRAVLRERALRSGQEG